MLQFDVLLSNSLHSIILAMLLHSFHKFINIDFILKSHNINKKCYKIRHKFSILDTIISIFPICPSN